MLPAPAAAAAAASNGFFLLALSYQDYFMDLRVLVWNGYGLLTYDLVVKKECTRVTDLL